MDCRTALEFLDCVRPNSGDLELSEFADARAHLAECDSCQAEFDRRQQFDTEISRVAADVPVPASLRMSLLAAVSDSIAEFADAGVETGKQPASAAAPNSLQRVRRIVSMSVCLLIAAVLVALWPTGLTQFSVAAIQKELNLNLPKVTFDDAFPIDAPSSWGGQSGLRISETLSGLDLDDRDGHDAAAAYFAFSAGRRAPIRGVLLAIPAARVSDLPSATVFSRAPVAYPQPGIVSVTWQEGDLVYVCFVSGDTTLLERMQRGMTGTAA